MKIAFDNTFLSLLIRPDSPARPNPATGEVVEFLWDRIEDLIDMISSKGDSVIIPAPAIAEVMCLARPPIEVISKINSFKCLEPHPFDQRAAITLAEITQKHHGQISDLRRDNTWARQRVKVDIQIVAVAITHGAEVIYTDDESQAAFAELCGLKVVHNWHLPLSAKNSQPSLFDIAPKG